MKTAGRIMFLWVLPFILIIGATFIGPVAELGPSEIIAWLHNQLSGSGTMPDGREQMIRIVLMEVRLPRILMAFLAGGALSVSGAAIQGVFRNPLASPYILGISSGAAFGAAFALAGGWIMPQLSAFFFALMATFLCYLIAVKKGKVSIASLILGGIIVSGIFTALLTMVQYLSDPFKLQTIVHWTMGNLHNANKENLLTALIPIGIGTIGILILRWRLNLLALGDHEARQSGMNLTQQKLLLISLATLATSGAIAVSGIIGFIDLIIPHMVRLTLGADNKKVVPYSFVSGGIFLLLIDTFSRSAGSYEIPAGVITMLIGAPIFIIILKRTKIQWGI